MQALAKLSARCSGRPRCGQWRRPVKLVDDYRLLLRIEVDVGAERDRLDKEIARLEANSQSRRQLGNASFVERAPLQSSRRRRNDWPLRATLQKLREQRGRLPPLRRLSQRRYAAQRRARSARACGECAASEPMPQAFCIACRSDDAQLAAGEYIRRLALAGPHIGQRQHARFDDQRHFVPGIVAAQICAAIFDDEPPHTLARPRIGKTEVNHDTAPAEIRRVAQNAARPTLRSRHRADRAATGCRSSAHPSDRAPSRSGAAPRRPLSTGIHWRSRHGRARRRRSARACAAAARASPTCEARHGECR